MTPKVYHPARLPQTRPDSAHWTAAKAHGDAGELRAVVAWAGAGFTAYVKPGSNKHDLLTMAAVEVKNDRLAASTGHVAVEVACRGRESGLAASDAALWHFDLGAEVLVISRGRLSELVNAGQFRHVKGGDDGASDLILVPVADLRRSALLVLPAPGVAP